MAARYTAFCERWPEAGLPALPSHAELKDKLKLLESVLGVGFIDARGDHTGLYEDLIIAFHLFRLRNRISGDFDSPGDAGAPCEFQELVLDRAERLPKFLADKITPVYKDISLPRAAWFELIDISDELLGDLYATTTPAPRAQSAPTPPEPRPPSAAAPPAAKRSRSEEAPK